MSRESLSTVVVATLAVCSVVITMHWVASSTAPHGAVADATPSGRFVRHWRWLSSTGHRDGPASAPVKVVEFADFQCPACRALAPTVRALPRLSPKVAVVTRAFPLTRIHPLARMAALAAECASAQGRYSEMSDVLYATQDSLGILPWGDFVRRAGLSDSAAFRRCLRDTTTARVVAADVLSGRRLGVVATPTFVVNDSLYVGLAPAQLVRLVKRDLALVARQ